VNIEDKGCFHSAPERGVNELDPVSFFDLCRSKILTVHEPAVQFDNHSGIVFPGSVEQISDRHFATVQVFRKTVEYDSQFKPL